MGNTRDLLKLFDSFDEVARAQQIRSQSAIQQEQERNDEGDYNEVLQNMISDRELAVISASSALGRRVWQVLFASTWKRIATPAA